MTDESTLPIEEEGSLPPKSLHFCYQRYLIPLCLILLVGILGLLIYLQPFSWFVTNPTAQEISILKGQTASLTTRIEALEAVETGSIAPSIDPERIKDIESRITALSQQIEAIQNQPKAEMPPQRIEQPHAFEKELNRFAQIQKTLKSFILFLRLRTKILSESPYLRELNEFKDTTKNIEGFSLLEQYAPQGLKVLKETQTNPQLSQPDKPGGSWWERLKAMADSFIKIEKVGMPIVSSPTSSQDRQTIEGILDQIDKTLTQELTVTSLNPSPQSGDAL